MAGGVIQVLKEANKLGEISVVSTGGSPEGIQLIKAGELEATAAASAGLEGALCFKAAWDAYRGKKVPKVINPPLMMATKDNIDSALTWEVNNTMIDIVENYKYEF
jgi:ABC-type sugar transport system substrate-binding protein